jgi:hypothetical protein
MDVFCVGMYRAGSTWQYHVVGHLVEQHLGGRRLGFVTGERFASLLPGEERGWRALKSHDAHPAFAAALTEGRALAVYSYRDLRDVACSLQHKFGGDFAEVIERQGRLHLCLDNDAFWTAQPHTLAQRYEEIVTDPPAAVRALGHHLGLTLAQGEAEAIAEQYSLRANLWRSVEVANRLREQGVNLDDPASAVRWDEETLLHWNHIRAGRVGGWRDEVTPREVAILAAICGRWLVERGYERDLAWALPALEHFREALEAAHRALREARTRLARQRDELDEYRRLGPVALALARHLHGLSTRYPRLSAGLKRLLPGRTEAALWPDR